jgi:NAD(P)-dependent dehydrogenase (short-subunit alcohol dehydrogenase family)
MNDRIFDGKRALITGSSRGIGATIATHFASLGASVTIHGSKRNSPSVFGEAASIDEAAERIRERYGVEAIAIAADLTDPAAVRELVEKTVEAFGGIDILVNCAGGDIGSRGVRAENAGKPVDNDGVYISIEDLRTVLERNLHSCIYVCREVLPAMIERRNGSVINIGSIAGAAGTPRSAIYATAKAAVHEYTRCLALQTRPFGVRVNAIAPGDTITERFKASRPLDEHRLRDDVGLERYGRSEEIASAVAWLAGEGSSYVTGQVIRVDGGLQAWPI